MHNGDAGPRLNFWSPNEPVTLFGALQTRVGWEDVSSTFRWVASRFSDCSSYEIELIAAGASGDLAYTVAYEHTTASVEGKPPHPYTLRVTHVYRREDGQWRVVHRHGPGTASGCLASECVAARSGDTTGAAPTRDDPPRVRERRLGGEHTRPGACTAGHSAASAAAASGLRSPRHERTLR